MTKTKTPFFSMGSRGTIGDTLTSQKRGQVTLVRTKPIPANPRSLAQMYQRWLYLDYAYDWRQKSAAIRQLYATAGSRFHLTGYQYWLKAMLGTLPDLQAWWKLDDNTGATTMDSSRNNNTATIVGASPADFIINGGLDFDGLNDRCTIPYSSTLVPTIPFSIDLFFSSSETGNFKGLMGNVDDATNLAPIAIYRPNGDVLRFHIYDGVGYDVLDSTIKLYDSVIHHLLITITATTLTMYVDGLFHVSTPRTRTPVTGTNYHWMLGGYSPVNLCQCYLDNVIIYNRTLLPADALRHSLRRYPL